MYGLTEASKLIEGKADTATHRGHQLEATGPPEPDSRPVRCRTCGMEAGATVEPSSFDPDRVRATFADALADRCNGSEATSAGEYLAAIGAPTNYRQAARTLALKHGGSLQKKLANNTYLARRTGSAQPDVFAVRLYDTDIVWYFKDGSVTVRTGGYYSKLTRQRIETYTGLRVWTDGPLDTRDGPPRWFLLRPTAEPRTGWHVDVRPHHYVRFDRPLRVFPHGGVKALSEEATRVRYSLQRGAGASGRPRGVYGSRRAAGFATY